ncbi:PadR family transcriptional regulator [Cellulomonas persica]|uniref:PadR family transcriptional regulator n=1 Tax=Cellulomonas persica TaxID=76861 RepID=UPI0027D98B8C|nr:helix-turn-helix transcriptional regulator [Cellulomonas persica]
MLSRLRRLGWVETTWQESTSGPPRRYYELTADGRYALEQFTRAWEPFRQDVDTVLAESR